MADTQEHNRWFNNPIKPKQILDKEGNAITEGRVVANAFWPKQEVNIPIKALSDKHPKTTRKQHDKGFK